MRNVIVVGDAILDETITVRVRGVSPESEGTLVVQPQATKYGLGGAANVALNAKSLGADVSVFSLYGTDGASSRVRSMLTAHDIHELGTVLTTPESLYGKIKTPQKTRYVTADGRQLLRVDVEDPSAVASCWTGYKQSVISALAPYVKKKPAPIIVLVNYDKGLFTVEAVSAIMEILDRSESIVLVDPGRYGLWHRFSSKRTIFKANVSQCIAHEHANIANVRNLWPVLEPTLKHYNPHLLYTHHIYNSIWTRTCDNLKRLNTEFSHLWLTLGAGGMIVGGATDVDPYRTSSGRIQVADVTGAGDTAMGAAAHYLSTMDECRDINNNAVQRAVYAAELAAYVAVQRSGCYVVTRDDIGGVV